ncbi:MAG: oligoendopeptidase F [Firmicutes bacterium]|nr:oligoendopeptidase F [Bacillota bacterium]
MRREDIANEYKWDLSHLVADDESWEQLVSSVQERLPLLAQYEGQLGDKQVLKECLEKMTEIEKDFGRIVTYATMHKDENTKNFGYVAMADRAHSLGASLAAATSFVVPQLSKMEDEYLQGLLVDYDFSDYDMMIKGIIRAKAHILNDGEEKILALASDVLHTFYNTHGAFDNADLKLPKIKLDGKWVTLTHGTYAMALQNSNQKTRKDAFDNLYRAYAKNINTLASNYAGAVKAGVLMAKVRGYKNALARELDGEGIPTAVYDNLIQAVGDALPMLHEYVAYRATYFDECNMYDMYLPLIEGADIKMEYEDAYELVKTALQPLGDEYQELLCKAKQESWIDVYETDNKRSGAYSWGTYGVHPYVLLNYKQTTHDIFTVAHEMGHAMHSYYSSEALPFSKAEYSIFNAEVASTVNEVLLIKHLLSTTTDKHLRRYLNQYYLDMFRTTIFRQTMFSEFERTSHEMVESGQSLTSGALCDVYYQLNQKYYGEAVKHNDAIKYEWSRIPHFYRPFYVYKYATGLTTAVCLAKKILQGDTESYFAFLKSGGSKLPHDILVDAGVDLTTTEPYEIAMQEFRDALAELLK